MKRITTQDALRALEEAVAEKGEDYVYPRAQPDNGAECAYLEWDHNNKLVPSCIAGNALCRLGVPIDDLFEYNLGWGLWALVDKLGLSGEKGAWVALATAQDNQDEAAPWGYALTRAREVVAPDA